MRLNPTHTLYFHTVCTAIRGARTVRFLFRVISICSFASHKVTLWTLHALSLTLTRNCRPEHWGDSSSLRSIFGWDTLSVLYQRSVCIFRLLVSIYISKKWMSNRRTANPIWNISRELDTHDSGWSLTFLSPMTRMFAWDPERHHISSGQGVNVSPWWIWKVNVTRQDCSRLIAEA